MANILREISDSASAVAKGFKVTPKNMLGPTVTENYPDEPGSFEDR
jgi:formate hydrogenlyase subunit 6/NADH:ubiquinone oxidoreductase subunit I